jgi:hypothetical protein
MPGHKADVHHKRRSQALQMARGDSGQNRLNDFFGVFTQGIDNMLYEFGLFKDQETRANPPKKPLQGQDKAQSRKANSRVQSNTDSPTPTDIQTQSGSSAVRSGSSKGRTQSLMSDNPDKQSGNS